MADTDNPHTTTPPPRTDPPTGDSPVGEIPDGEAPAKRGPFTFEFNFDDNYCSAGVDAAAEYAPADLREKIVQLDDVSALDLLTAAAAEHAGNDERAGQCQDAADRLTRCRTGCCCASDTWDSMRPNLDAMLSGIGTQVWAVRCNNRTDHDIDDVLTHEMLFAVANWRDGWSRVEVTWDGTAVTATYHSDGGARAVVTAAALTDEQMAWFTPWGEADPYHAELASVVRETKPYVLNAAAKIWAAFEPAGHPNEFGDYVSAVEELHITAISDDVVEIACGLYDDEWTDGITGLLHTAYRLHLMDLEQECPDPEGPVHENSEQEKSGPLILAGAA